MSTQERNRVRQGNYHIIYGIEEAEVVVESVKAGHRRGGIRARVHLTGADNSAPRKPVIPAQAGIQVGVDSGLPPTG
jgi:hypothetical protein